MVEPPGKQSVVELFLPNPLDWDEAPEDLFQFDNPVFWQENEQGKLSCRCSVVHTRCFC